MIRIDEIYSTTFWPWLQRHRPCMRMFYFWPFGRSDQDSIYNYGNDNQILNNARFIVQNADRIDNNYTLFFDQEPIDLARHRPAFDRVKQEKTADINMVWLAQQQLAHGRFYQPTELPKTGYLVTSEKNSATVDQVCREYGWQPLYYFFHGWAALDWYRGYNRTYLMPEPPDRRITRTFIMPNRIIAGDRNHRLIMLYHIFRMGMQDNHISCPLVCPAENTTVHEAVESLASQYPDIAEVFRIESFPKQFVGEANAPMHSYQLSLFNECSESLLYLVTETVAQGQRLHLTEKTFKPIALGMPFVLVSTAHSLAYLRSYGFRTFDTLWDESYDAIEDDSARYRAVAELLKKLDTLNPVEKQHLFDSAQEICEHNYEHFYSGGFERVLWAELTQMLQELTQDA